MNLNTSFGDKISVGEIQNHCTLFQGSDIEKTEKLKTKTPLGDFIFEKTGLRSEVISLNTGRIISWQKSWLGLRKAQRNFINLSNLKNSSENAFNPANEGKWLPRGTFLGFFIYTTPTSGDIVQGLPRIDALFEARSATGLAEHMISVFNSLVEKGLDSRQATKAAFTAIQELLICRIQEAYLDQGVQIDDKHLEVIVRQMTSKVLINYSGDSPCVPGDLIPLEEAEAFCGALKALGLEELTYEPTLIGITKSALQKQGFLSPASFQDTIRVLLRCSLEAQQDPVRGLKEHVILGQSLPSGTGHRASQLFN